jgi:O-methyltransferase
MNREETRCVWPADSFAGLPRPDPAKYKADKGVRLDRFASILGVSEADAGRISSATGC